MCIDLEEFGYKNDTRNNALKLSQMCALCVLFTSVTAGCLNRQCTTTTTNSDIGHEPSRKPTKSHSLWLDSSSTIRKKPSSQGEGRTL
ncbi:hypothetical protein HanXRQr2_Chr13g0617251 [Helianthus annuus]|uniref:Uncharacterized protein n=1 Tax=Helianthus annuus TaxID=4232 RepID=A0A9K3ELG4_HELAN|nr:hypothetical protein HanXRQr2_Chr13g0617251 [Helianthus annuus]